MATSWLDAYNSSLAAAPPRAGVSLPKPPSNLVVPPAQSAPGSNVQLTPGYSPDYSALIQADPSYQLWMTNGQQSLSTASAQRRAALRALVAAYGGLPAGTTDPYGDIDQATLDAASANDQSTEARQQRNYDQTVQALKASLAARGALSSGDLQYGLDQADMANASTEYDNEQQLASSFMNALNSYLGSQNDFYGGEYDAMENALQNQIANPANAPVSPTYAQLDPDWQTKYGVPVYQGEDGSLYDASGNGFDPRVQSVPVQSDQPWSVGKDKWVV